MSVSIRRSCASRVRNPNNINRMKLSVSQVPESQHVQNVKKHEKEPKPANQMVPIWMIVTIMRCNMYFHWKDKIHQCHLKILCNAYCFYCRQYEKAEEIESYFCSLKSKSTDWNLHSWKELQLLTFSTLQLWQIFS